MKKKLHIKGLTMKLTKTKLKQIIKEELSQFMEIQAHSYKASGASKKGVYVIKTRSGYVKGDNGVKHWKDKVQAEASDEADQGTVTQVDLINKASREGETNWNVA
jgi:hypothetical protein